MTQKYSFLTWKEFKPRFRYTEHLLRQRPSSPTTTISYPLRLVPFEAVADKGPWLLLVVFIVVYIVLFKEDKLVP
ncbi:hypothetical protein JHK84_047826 [Glycine max]|nr:hypothetical protein JHK84_047826 [Glycine max]